WPPSRDRIDAEYQEHIRRIAEATLDRARELVPADIQADYLVRGAASSRRGLLEVSDSLDAHRLVVGPRAAGTDGRIARGSLSNRLPHSASLPVALAPAGYRAEAGARLQRISAAYSGSSTSAGLIIGAAMVSAAADVPCRIVSFAPRPRVISAAGSGLRAGSDVVDGRGAVGREHMDQ